jgi:peptide deformylase
MNSDVIKINTDGDGGTTIQPDIEILALVDENDPILKCTTPEFDFENPTLNPVEFASQLVETCKLKGGFGLAAPQVGVAERVFVMGSGEDFVAFFNPRILNSSKETSMVAEGCLSFPMLALKVERPSQVEVEYQDFNGVTRTGIFSGLSAHCFQHELDHLNGVCYTDRAKPMALKMGLKKRKKFHNLVDRYNKAQGKIQTLTN